jgi:hypothetical protein
VLCSGSIDAAKTKARFLAASPDPPQGPAARRPWRVTLL